MFLHYYLHELSEEDAARIGSPFPIRLSMVWVLSEAIIYPQATTSMSGYKNKFGASDPNAAFKASTSARFSRRFCSISCSISAINSRLSSIS